MRSRCVWSANAADNRLARRTLLFLGLLKHVCPPKTLHLFQESFIASLILAQDERESACLTHASRMGLLPHGVRVSNTWAPAPRWGIMEGNLR